ncbi:MAG: hypothetical protein GX757_08090 [Clostridiales bacterium]|nr:hypothetical protein [Clostridiales bacterium]
MYLPAMPIFHSLWRNLNFCVAKDGASWEMLSNGAFYYQDDDGSFLGENKDLYDEVLQRNREDLSKP